MSIMNSIGKVMGAIHDVGTEMIAPAIGKVANVGLKTGIKGGSTIINKGAGVLEKGIKSGAKTVKNIKSGEFGEKIGKATEKVIGNTLSNPDSYKTMFKIPGKNATVMGSNKTLFADDMERRIKSLGDKGATAYNASLKNGLLKKDPTNALGHKISGVGALAAMGIMGVSGVPEAAKSYVEGRKGYNDEQQARTSAPTLPAYADNGGATGDLVFALNNLRHGGMM